MMLDLAVVAVGMVGGIAWGSVAGLAWIEQHYRWQLESASWNRNGRRA
jgi:hypothetical protein